MSEYSYRAYKKDDEDSDDEQGPSESGAVNAEVVLASDLVGKVALTQDLQSIKNEKTLVGQILQYFGIKVRRRNQMKAIEGHREMLEAQKDLVSAATHYELEVAGHSRVPLAAKLEHRKFELALIQVDRQILSEKLAMDAQIRAAQPKEVFGSERLQEKELERALARIQADIEESRLRAAEAQYWRKHIHEYANPVVPAQPSQPPLPPKPTVEEVREKKVRYQRVQDEDQVALRLDRIDLSQRTHTRLRKFGLDEDECDHVTREIMESLGEEGKPRRTL